MVDTPIPEPKEKLLFLALIGQKLLLQKFRVRINFKMDTQYKQIENYLEFVREIVQKTLELYQAQQAEKDKKMQMCQKN